VRDSTAIDHPATRRRALFASLAGICLLSVPAFCTRFLNDMAYYSLVSDKLLRGGVLYRNAIDTKPPLIFLHYAAVFTLFGRDNVTAVKIVTMAWLFCSSLMMSAIYRELFPNSRRPELAALLFVLASFSGWGEDFLSSNTEILSNAFVLAGLWLMVKDGFGSRASQLVPAGALVGIALLYRYQAAAILAAYTIAILAVPAQFDRRIRRLVFLACGAAIPALAVAAYYSRIDGLRDLMFLLQYQRLYVGHHELYWPQVLGQVGIVAASQGLIILIVASQVRRMARRPVSRRDLFLLLFLFFSVLPFFIGGHYFAHYIVQAIPAFVLLATERLYPSEHASDGQREGWFFTHARALILIQVGVFWLINTAYYTARPVDAPTPNLSRFVRMQTRPADTVFVWTWESHILFDIDRVYATRFLSNEFLTGRLYGSKYRRASTTADEARASAVLELWPELLDDLQRERPRLIVDDAPGRSNFTIDHYPALSAFVRAYYEPGQVMDGLCVYVRKAG
jgi:hypothetical protein